MAPVETPEVVEDIEIEREPIEELITNAHGYDVFLKDGIYAIYDDNIKYVSSDFDRIQDKALELKDSHTPTIEEPETYQSVALQEVVPGKFKFTSPWGNGFIKVEQLLDKEKIQIIHNGDVFFGDAKLGSYYGNFDRIQELIRTNLAAPEIDEAAEFRRWSDASGKTVYEQIFGDKDE